MGQVSTGEWLEATNNQDGVKWDARTLTVHSHNKITTYPPFGADIARTTKRAIRAPIS